LAGYHSFAVYLIFRRDQNKAILFVHFEKAEEKDHTLFNRMRDHCQGCLKKIKKKVLLHVSHHSDTRRKQSERML